MYKTFDELIDSRLKGLSETRKVAVVCAEEEHTLTAVLKAYDAGLANPILIGNKKEIESILNKMGRTEAFQIYDVDGPEACVAHFVELAKAGQCNAVMKGNLDSKILLKAVVSSKNGLKISDAITSVSIYQIPRYHKLLCVTDSGVMTYPSYEQKKSILKNAIDTFRFLGYEKPKAGVLCAVEKLNEKMPETIDAAELQKEAENGAFGDAYVCGPISLDLCLDKESAAIKGFDNPVAGDADIIVVNNIHTGNALSKSLSFCAGATACSLLVGSRIPIIFTSRASSIETKYRSLLVALSMDCN